MKKQLLIYFLGLILFNISLSAQNTSSNKGKLFYDALDFFSNQEYEKALQLLLKLDKQKTKHFFIKPSQTLYVLAEKKLSLEDILIKYYISSCRLRKKNPQLKKLPSLVSFLKKHYSNISPHIYNDLGVLYHQDYQFDKSIFYFREFLKYDWIKLEHQAMHMLDICENAKKITADTLDTKIEKVDYPINSDNAETYPVLINNDKMMYFTRVEYKETAAGLDSVKQIMYSKKIFGVWTHPQKLKITVKRKFQDINLAGISPDGKKLYFLIKTNNQTDIYSSQVIDNECINLKKLSKKINTKYNEGRLCFSSDGKTMYFSSDRPEGYGKMDIYISKKDETGRWQSSKNLGLIINTPFSETAPLLHPSNELLYFSSNGHSSMGYFDIFMSIRNKKGSWLAPKNMGFPINSTLNDMFSALSDDGYFSYMSVSQYNNFNNSNVYLVDLRQKIPFTLIRGQLNVKNGSGNNQAKFKIFDVETGKRIKYIYSPKKNGKYFLILPPGKAYHLSIQLENYPSQLVELHIPEQYYFYELFQEIDIEPIILSNTKLGHELRVKNTFYDVYRSAAPDSSWTSILRQKSIYYKRSSVLVNEIVNKTESLEIEEIDSIPKLKYRKNMPRKERDYLSLNELIEESIENSDTTMLRLLQEKSVEQEVYQQNYFYDAKGVKTLEYQQILGQDTIYTNTILVAYNPDNQEDTTSIVSEKVKSHKLISQILEKQKQLKDSLKQIARPDSLQKREIFLYQIYFSVGTWTLSKKDVQLLSKISDFLINNPQTKFLIEGYSDLGGSKNTNLKLSKKRARHVLELLHRHGVKKVRGSLKFYGDSKSENSNRKDRRVSIKIFE